MPETTLDISEARKQFSRIDERLRQDRVIKITRRNRPAFAVVDLNYLEALHETLDVLSDPQSVDMLQRSIDDAKAGRVFDHEEVKRELL